MFFCCFFFGQNLEKKKVVLWSGPNIAERGWEGGVEEGEAVPARKALIFFLT